MKDLPTFARPLLLAGALLAAPLARAEDDSLDREALRAELDAVRAELAETALKMARLQRQLVEDDAAPARWEMKSDDGKKNVQVVIDEAMNFEFIGSRPKLGILIGPGQDRSEVLGLTPGGGAVAAGIQRGDRLVSVNGTALSDDATIADALQGVEPGERVPVRVERNGETLDFEVETSAPGRNLRAMVERFVTGEEGLQHFEALGEELAGLNEEMIVIRNATADAPLPPRLPGLFGLGGDSHLVSNHDGLAPYFGTGEGVVVLRIAADNALQLRDGDVILSIDGDPVERPVDLGRAMLERDAGETVILDVMRSGTLQRIEGEVPDSRFPHLDHGRGLGLMLPAERLAPAPPFPRVIAPPARLESM